MPYVSSEAISRIEWSDGILSVWFRDSGKRYDHPNVEESVYQDFLRAGSKGTFYANRIRGRY